MRVRMRIRVTASEGTRSEIFRENTTTGKCEA